MSFLDHLNEATIDVESLFEETEIVDVEVLEEAISKFADLPAAWKKVFGRNASSGTKNAGENSEIEVKSTGKIKNKTAYNKLLKQALADTENTAGVIIEIDGEPLVAIASYYNSEKKYRVIYNAGTVAQVTRSRWDKGSRHRPPKTHYWKESELRVQETIDAVNSALSSIAIIKANNAQDDETKHIKYASTEEVIQLLDISFKVLHRDANRIEKQGARKDAKSDRDDFKGNARNVIKKFTTEHVSGLVDEIKEQLPKVGDVEDLLNRAANGEKVVFDVKGIEDRIKRLNRVLHYFESAHKEGKIKDKRWNGTAELSWDMKQLVSILKGKD